MKTLRVAILLSALLLTISFVAYNTATSETYHQETDTSAELFVVGNTSGFPEGCGPIPLTHIILNFFDAYNNGQVERFPEFFPSRFEWYSDTRGEPEQGLHFVVSNREDLLPYFAERHRQHERLSLIALHMIAPDAERPDLVNLSYSLQRQADDLELGLDGVARLGGGKGAILCSQAKIYVWSMYVAPPDETIPMWSSECAKPANTVTLSETASSVTVCVGDN